MSDMALVMNLFCNMAFQRNKLAASAVLSQSRRRKSREQRLKEKGFGFVRPDDGGSDLFAPLRTFSGDEVPSLGGFGREIVQAHHPGLALPFLHNHLVIIFIIHLQSHVRDTMELPWPLLCFWLGHYDIYMPPPRHPEPSMLQVKRMTVLFVGKNHTPLSLKHGLCLRLNTTPLTLEGQVALHLFFLFSLLCLGRCHFNAHRRHLWGGSDGGWQDIPAAYVSRNCR